MSEYTLHSNFLPDFKMKPVTELICSSSRPLNAEVHDSTPVLSIASTNTHIHFMYLKMQESRLLSTNTSGYIGKCWIDRITIRTAKKEKYYEK